jgi:phosphoserine phosphatase RsbU/P
MISPVSGTYFHDALVERRGHLERALEVTPSPEVVDLLARVDAALERLDHGRFGLCEACHDHIETDRLVRDPLARYCRDHPGPAEEVRIRRELALAREIQFSLLPRPDLAIDGWRYAYRYEAAGEVGGDFCDVIARPHREETLILVGDVAGKGVAASMLMSHLVATLRSLAPLPLATSELLSRANDLFHDGTAAPAYATLAAASLQRNGSVELYSAGHWAPLVRRGASVDRTVVAPGLPIGLFAGSRYIPTRVDLTTGDALLFFTDGVVDAENSDGEDYNLTRLSETLGSRDTVDLQALVNHCHHDVRQFEAGAAPGDDLLLLAVGRAAHRSSSRRR